MFNIYETIIMCNELTRKILSGEERNLERTHMIAKILNTIIASIKVEIEYDKMRKTVK